MYAGLLNSQKQSSGNNQQWKVQKSEQEIGLKTATARKGIFAL